jgi:hypothetical protein
MYASLSLYLTTNTIHLGRLPLEIKMNLGVADVYCNYHE